VSDILQRTPGVPAEPYLYAPWQQQTSRRLRVVVRTSGDPLAIAPALRSLIRELAPTMPVSEFTPLEQVLASSVARPRFYTTLLALFAGVALLLAAIGIFGVMSYSVAQRTRELSIRMALGARRGEVLAMIVGRSMALAGAGLAIGIAGALALGRVLGSQLYNVSLGDPLTHVAVVLVLAATALAASFIPAHRATRVDPGLALRE
jgi:putative ABC transport system permease protein